MPRANSVQIWSWKVAMVARYDVINSIRLATSKKNARYFLYKKIAHSIVPKKEKYLIIAY